MNWIWGKKKKKTLDVAVFYKRPHCLFIFLRDGRRSGVVVRDGMHALHGPGELPALREGERHRAP